MEKTKAKRSAHSFEKSKFDENKKSKLRQKEMLPPSIFLCVADLLKPSEDIKIEFFELCERRLLRVTEFKELHPRSVSLFPFTNLDQDWSLSFSTIISSSSKLYCLGGAAPTDRVTGPFTTLNNYSQYNSVNRSELYCYNNYDDADRFHLFKPIRDVYVNNLYEPTQWMPLPPMSIGRCRPFILSREGKIYVFGCRLTPLKYLQPFAEVYDPFTNDWTTLIDCVPPLLFGLDKPATANCVFVENQTKVLVILSEENISFTWPLESSIDDYPSPYSCCPFVYSTDPIVVVKDIAFVFINSQKLYAYRLKNGMFCDDDQSPDEPTLVKGFVNPFLGSPTYPSFFFHVDHMRFCMVWQDFYPTKFCYLMFHIVGDSLEDMVANVDGFWSHSTEGDSSLLSASM